MEVQADLSDGYDLRAPRQALQRGPVARRIEAPGLVRMNPDRREDPVVMPGELDGRFRVGQSRPRYEEARDAGRPRPLQQRGDRQGTALHLEVAVGIRENL